MNADDRLGSCLAAAAALAACIAAEAVMQGPMDLAPMAAGWLLGTLQFAAHPLLYRFSIGKPTKSLLLVGVGGNILRGFLLICVFYIVNKTGVMDPWSFSSAMLITYFITMIAEIRTMLRMAGG